MRRRLERCSQMAVQLVLMAEEGVEVEEGRLPDQSDFRALL